MGLLNRLGRRDTPATAQDRQVVSEAVERVAALHPQLRLARHYQKRLAPAVAASIEYVRRLVEAVPAPREASAAAWAVDPYIHVYFVGPDDVAQVISRAADLRAYFVRNEDMPEAYAVLGMALTERHILGVGMEGDSLRRDVPQTTVSFSDHQLRLCGRSDAELRREIVLRLLDQLALEGLARTAAEKSRRAMLEREQALLKTRLQLLERQGSGIRALLGNEATAGPDELARLAAQLDENERDLAGLGLREDTLDRDLEQVRAVFAEPGRHLDVSTRQVRLNRMNVVVEQGSAQPGDDFVFQIARLPGTPPVVRAFSLVRFARGDLLPEKSMFEQASQLLSSGLLS